MSNYENESAVDKFLANRPLVIGIMALLLVLNGVTLFLYFQEKQEAETMLSASNQDLEEARNKLESISNELDLKIEEIQKLGGDVDTLRQLREELELEKASLMKARDVDRKTINQINARVAGYKQLLLKKDEEIAELKQVNDQLLTQNTSLMQEQKKLNQSLSTVEEKSQKLAEKVEIASQLKAADIHVVGMNDRGKGKERDVYRNNQIAQMQLNFKLEKNDVAPIGGHDIMIRVIQPNGEVLFDVAKGSGTFMKDGKEEFFTSKQNILFDNSQQALSFVYEKGSDYTEGKHTIEIYADDYVIGRADFVIK